MAPDTAGPGHDADFVDYGGKIKTHRSSASIKSGRSRSKANGGPKAKARGSESEGTDAAPARRNGRRSESSTDDGARKARRRKSTSSRVAEEDDEQPPRPARSRSRPTSTSSKPRSRSASRRGSRRNSGVEDAGAPDDDPADDSPVEMPILYASAPVIKRRNSVRSAKSFLEAEKKFDESATSDADDPSDHEPTKRAPSSASRKRRPSMGSRRSSRAPKGSDDERRSLRSPKSASIFDDRVVDDDDASLDAKPRVGSVRLTAVERHYLNKALLCLQMQREWSALANIGELAMYGEPFLPHPTGPQSKPEAPKEAKAGLFASLPIIGGGAKDTASQAPKRETSWDKPLDPPMLKYLFWRFIKNFPGLDQAKDEYWQARIQPFFDSFAERNFSVTRERGEVTKRRLLAMGFTRILGTYLGAGITALGDAAPSRPDAMLMRRVDCLFPGSMQSQHKILIGKAMQPEAKQRYNAWCAVPAASEQDGEYTVITRVLAADDRPVFVVERTLEAFKTFADRLEEHSPVNELGLPLLPYAEGTNDFPDRLSLQRWLRTVVILLSNPTEAAKASGGLTKARVQLERFLLDKPSRDDRRQSELLDMARQDDERGEREKKAWIAAGKRARSLRTTWAMYRDALIGARELDKSWALVTRFDRYKDLPRLHRDAEEWACLWVAYTLHYLYTTSPQSADLFTLTKSFHGLIPYGLLKTGLRIANPTIMIKTVVNIVLGQPMGQPSLFQRIFGIVMSSEIKRRKKDVDSFRASLGEPHICDIIEGYVYAPRSTQEKVRQISYEEDEDIIVTILREGDLGKKDLDEVLDWRDAFIDSGLTVDDAFAEGKIRKKLGDDAKKYLQLKGLLRALCIKRDREQVLEIVNEPNTPLLLKASISVFYKGIYEIAEACNLADRLGDLQAFLQDLVETVDKGETDTSDFIRLCKRHDQSLYYFIHELFAYGGTLCDPLKEWSRSGLNLLKTGIPDRQKQGRDARRLGADVDRLLNESDPGARDEIQKEIRGLMQWTRLRKVQNDIWLRCDLMATDAKSPLHLNAYDVVAQFTEEEREAVDYIESASGATRAEAGVAWAWFGETDILESGTDIRRDWRAAAQSLMRDKEGGDKKKKKGGGTTAKTAPATVEVGTLLPPPPRLLATKTLVEPYIDSLRRSFNAAKEQRIK